MSRGKLGARGSQLLKHGRHGFKPIDDPLQNVCGSGPTQKRASTVQQLCRTRLTAAGAGPTRALRA
eukprot:1768120-Prymnesium_polylepis.1